jgi:hypothetical protein
MITKTDLKSIDLGYFEILEATPFYIVLYSRNTGQWHLLEQEPNHHRSFYIFHKHHSYDAYHPQTCRRSVVACFQYIKGHDSFHMKREETRKRKIEEHEEKLYGH